MKIQHVLIALGLSVFLSSCGLFGIHFKVHNPKRAGKYPKFDKETILLGENTAIRKGFDVTFYHLDLDFNPEKKSLGGWVEVKARARGAIDSIQLDLDQPLQIEELRWQTRDGKSLNYKRDYRAIFIQLPEKLSANTFFSVHVKYRGKPVIARKPPWAGGTVWKKDNQNFHWAGVACETEGASIWFPCKDHTSDEPDSVAMRFTVPGKDLVAVSNGVLEGVQTNETSRTFNWRVHYPINTYNITFYLGNFTEINDIYTGIKGKELKLSYYVLKPNEEKALSHFKQVHRQLKAYEQIYGEYPWYKDGFRLIESPYAGMEHQTAIAYGNGYKNDLNGKEDYIILHEMGHEWFGNSITAADLAHVWLQEGFTTFGEYLYLEKEYSPQEAFNHLLFYRFTIKNKRPLVGPADRRYFSYKDGDVYVKGAWMLYSLRNTIKDDSLFFNIIKTFYTENKMRVVRSQDFVDCVNRMTGKDYNWFFNQYLYQRKAPFIEAQLGKDGTFYYRWTDTNADFNKLPVEVKFLSETVELFPDQHIKKIKTAAFKSSDIMINNNKALFGIRWSNKLEKAFKKQNLNPAEGLKSDRD